MRRLCGLGALLLPGMCDAVISCGRHPQLWGVQVSGGASCD